MPPCKGIGPRKYPYFCFATNAEKGPRQGEHKSTKTSNIEMIKFPISLIRLKLFLLLVLS